MHGVAEEDVCTGSGPMSCAEIGVFSRGGQHVPGGGDESWLRIERLMGSSSGDDRGRCQKQSRPTAGGGEQPGSQHASCCNKVCRTLTWPRADDSSNASGFISDIHNAYLHEACAQRADRRQLRVGRRQSALPPRAVRCSRYGEYLLRRLREQQRESMRRFLAFRNWMCLVPAVKPHGSAGLRILASRPPPPPSHITDRLPARPYPSVDLSVAS